MHIPQYACLFVCAFICPSITISLKRKTFFFYIIWLILLAKNRFFYCFRFFTVLAILKYEGSNFPIPTLSCVSVFVAIASKVTGEC